MTMALCFNCGETKFGALCPCESCDAGSTGNVNLDIAFSDHRMSLETLKAFGEVVKAIRRVCDNDELRFWSFLSYISTNHSDILTIKLESKFQRPVAEILARADPPSVEVQESEQAKFMRERGGNGDGT